MPHVVLHVMPTLSRFDAAERQRGPNSSARGCVCVMTNPDEFYPDEPILMSHGCVRVAGGGDPYGHRLASLAAAVAIQLAAERDSSVFGALEQTGASYSFSGLCLLLRHQVREMRRGAVISPASVVTANPNPNISVSCRRITSENNDA